MSKGTSSPLHSYTPLALCTINTLHTTKSSFSSRTLLTGPFPLTACQPDSWNVSVDEIARISLLSDSFQQLLSRTFRQALVCVNISNVSVFSALTTFVLFGFRLPFRILSLRPERRGPTGFLRRQLLRTQAGPCRPLRKKAVRAGLTRALFSVAPGREKSWGGGRPRIHVLRPRRATPKPSDGAGRCVGD